MNKKFVSSLCAGCLGAASLVYGSSAGAQAQSEEQADGASIQRAAERFVSEKRTEHSRLETLMVARGRGNELPQLRSLISKSQFAIPSLAGIDEETRRALTDRLIAEAAIRLAASNLTPDKVARYRNAGFNPLDAAISFTRGTPNAIELATLSSRVLVGKVTGVEETAAPTSMVTFEASDMLLGGGETVFTFEQGGSPGAPLHSTIMRAGEGRYLLFLTDPEGNLRRNSQRQATVSTNLVTPFSERDGKFYPLALSTLDPIDLGELRAQIAPLAQLKKPDNK